MPLRRSALVLLAGSMSLMAGCKGCRNDKPFVPYTIDGAPSVTSSVPSAPTAAPSSTSSFDGGAFARVSSQPAPPGTSTWSLGGLAIAAPPGRVFLQGLVLNQPGQPAIVAAYVGDGGSLAGEVVVYRSDASGHVVGPTTLARLPDWMPKAQGCQHLTTLSQIGPQTLWLDVIATCDKPEPKRLDRYLAAISVAAEGAVRVDLRGAELPPAERVVIDADASDHDDDGVDDLAVQITLEGATTPMVGSGHATALLRFLGRAQGMSRDTQEPGKSIRQQSTWDAQLAAKKGTSSDAMASARQVRRLYQLLCSEAGGPGIMLGDGSPIACGETATIEDARYAEARAALSAGDVAQALTGALRLRAARPKSKRAQELDTAIESDAKPKKMHARPLKVMPIESSIALPLAFEASGSLLVMGEEGMVRVDVTTGQESPAPDAAKWSPKALLVGDLRVQSEVDSCRSEPLKLLVQGSESRSLPLSILGSTAPDCPPATPLYLLDRNADGLVALVEGVPVNVSAAGDTAAVVAWPATPGPQGSTRSPDGKWTAIAAVDRVIVRGPDHAETWRPQPFFTLANCTVSNDAKAVACILEHGAVLLTP